MGEEQKITGGIKIVVIISVLMLMTTSLASNYSGYVVLPSYLAKINAMDFFSVCTASGSMGVMFVLPLAGVLCSKFGVKAVTLFGVGLQILARIGLMFTDFFIVFIVLWTLNGVGSGLFMSTPYAIMSDIVTVEERPKYYGYISAFCAIGALAGAPVAGAVLDWGYINIAMISYAIFAIIPFIGLGLFYPNKKRPSPGKFDFLGVLFLIITIAGVVMWLSLGGKFFGFISPLGLLLAAMGILGAAALVITERNCANPSVPIHMFKKPSFRAAFLIQMLIMAYISCAAVYGTVYVQQVMHGSSLASSTVTMPQTSIQAILSFFVGGYIGKNFRKRFRPAALLALAGYAIALIMFSSLQPASSMMIIYVATAFGGISQAIINSTIAPFFQIDLKPEEIESALGMFQFGLTGGSCIFVAVCGMVLNAGFTLNHVFMLGTAFCAIALVIGFFCFRFSKTETAKKPAAV